MTAARRFLRLGFLAWLMVAAVPAAAVEPDEILDDPALEARAREISAELRCLVCQNQSIDDSNAGLARDLRLLVRERLVAGDGDQAVIDHIHARYGDFVLLRPPMRPGTWLLWFGPLLFFALGALLVWRYLRGRPAAADGAPAAALSDGERQRLDAVLKQDASSGSSPTAPS